MIPAPRHPQDPLRPPGVVMRLSRMGAFHPTRLSFMRSLIRRLAAEGARVERPVWEIDAKGHGRAVYTVPLGGRAYSLVAVSTPLAPENRTDRVIAEAWDTTYALFDGRPGPDDLDRLAATLPRQEAGRMSAKELVLSRANKSVRLFAHTVDALAAGRQPDAAEIDRIGYLMRTTAVYGNGKFGLADRALIADRPAMAGPFRPEMLTVWLIRSFTHDLAEHIARARNPGAARLDPALKRHLGVGNATGLGMAPFLVTHPALLNSWMLARETALARVLAVARPGAAALARFEALIARARAHVDAWRVDDAAQAARIATLRHELALLAATPRASDHPWRAMRDTAAALSLETQEMLAALAIETHPELVDGLEDAMGAEAAPRLDPGATVAALRAALARDYDWALAIDFDDPAQRRRFWYVSAEKMEPRLGDRFEEPGAEKEQPLDIARQAQALAAALAEAPADEIVARFCMRRPDLRAIARRVQSAARFPYGEIRDNLIGEACLPIDMLRCKLSFFGASKFDPKSDRWTRVTLFQGAPTPETLGEAEADDWAFPVLGA